MNKGISTIPPNVPLTRVKLNVTQNHIDAGIPNNCRYCPIAMALAEIVWPSISVEISGIFYKFQRGKWFNALPQAAVLFIERFDSNSSHIARPIPSVFELDIPTDFLRI